jgi:hypothetical protein
MPLALRLSEVDSETSAAITEMPCLYRKNRHAGYYEQVFWTFLRPCPSTKPETGNANQGYQPHHAPQAPPHAGLYVRASCYPHIFGTQLYLGQATRGPPTAVLQKLVTLLLWRQQAS